MYIVINVNINKLLVVIEENIEIWGTMNPREGR